MKLAYLSHNDRGLFFRTERYEYLEDAEGLSTDDVFKRMPLSHWCNGAGKLYFPTKACAPYLCGGPAEIELVTAKDNFCFFSGHMVQFNAPSDENLCEYIYGSRLENALFTKRTGGIRGDYVVVTVNDEDYILVGDDCVKLYHVTDEQDNAVPGKTMYGKDFICLTKHGCDFAEFAQKFRTSFTKYEYAEQYSRVRINYVPDERLQSWVDSGIVELFVHTHRKATVMTANVYDTAEDILMAAHLFSPEELSECIELVNKMNADANAATQQFRDRKAAH